jgi:hypothetical protein
MPDNWENKIRSLDRDSITSLDWLFSEAWAFFRILDPSFLDKLKNIEPILNSELIKRNIDIQRFDMDCIFESVFQDAFSVSCQFQKRKGGCAFLGKTDFDKLERMTKCLLKFNWNDYKNNVNPSISNYVVIDCLSENIDYDIIKKYRDMPCVIFNNCECILGNMETIKMFARIFDKKKRANEFNTLSFYVFLGNENTMSKIANDYINSFCEYVTVYDCEKIYCG